DRRRCSVVAVDRSDGRVLDSVDLAHCFHGGGAALTADGLWVAGAGRLWLLDPDRLNVLRAWQVSPPVKASTIAVRGGRMVVGRFETGRRGTAWTFPIAAVTRPGVVRLVAGDPARDEVAAGQARRTPAMTQGLALGPGGVWSAASTTYCGVLTSPDGDRISFLPGAEGIAFAPDGALWVVSESGAWPYRRAGGRPRIAPLTRVPVRTLDREVSPGCSFG
ncbi:MAG TPA: hypothetical protein VFI99_12285, partial [Nocardioides sp.]|nr:hypothetical protein [Nocardioides sp.]